MLNLAPLPWATLRFQDARKADPTGTRGWNRPLQWWPLTTRGLQAPRFPGHQLGPRRPGTRARQAGVPRCRAGFPFPQVSLVALQLPAQLSSVSVTFRVWGSPRPGSSRSLRGWSQKYPLSQERKGGPGAPRLPGVHSVPFLSLQPVSISKVFSLVIPRSCDMGTPVGPSTPSLSLRTQGFP